jgi:hypothetical protein
MKETMFGGSDRLLRGCFLLLGSCTAVLMIWLSPSASASGGGDSNSRALERCTAAISGNQQQRGSLDEDETIHCVDLLVEKIARLQFKPELQRGKPAPPPPQEPPARSYHAFTWNGSATAAESRLFMFGGADGAAVAPDLWYYSDFEGGWQLAPNTGKSHPGPRFHVAWSCGAGECVAAHGVRGSPLQETWVYSTPNERWTQVNCRRHFCPSARVMGTMAYDPERGYHVLFGGYNYSYSMGDTHTFAGGRWTSHMPIQRPYRRDRAAAEFVTLPAVRAVVLHGGLQDASEILCDMFAWNGSAWVDIDAGPETSPCLHSHSMVWDESRERLVVTGGFTDLDDTANQAVWYFSFDTATTGNWTSDVESPFAQCVSAADLGARMAYDRATGEVVLFGGWRWVYDEVNEFWHTIQTDTLTICNLDGAPNL